MSTSNDQDGQEEQNHQTQPKEEPVNGSVVSNGTDK